ncbi:alpha/beta fold hydrolase [Roseobacteraceae bacterium S113]
MPRREIAGHETYWTTFGAGPRPALALHCSLAHSGAWGAVSRELTGAVTLTAFDQPGHGRSAPWDGAREIQGLCAEIAAGLMPGQRVDVIGHSFGATVALRFAVAHPERVRSMTLIEPVFFAVAFRDDPTAQARYDRDVARFSEAWARGDREAAAREFTAMWGGGVSWDALTPKQKGGLADQIHLIPAASAALHEDVGGILAPEALRAIEAPVVLMEGSNSHWIIPQINEGLCARLANAERLIVAGAGHMVPLTHPEQVGREILRLLARS